MSREKHQRAKSQELKIKFNRSRERRSWVEKMTKRKRREIVERKTNQIEQATAQKSFVDDLKRQYYQEKVQDWQKRQEEAKVIAEKLRVKKAEEKLQEAAEREHKFREFIKEKQHFMENLKLLSNEITEGVHRAEDFFSESIIKPRSSESKFLRDKRRIRSKRVIKVY